MDDTCGYLICLNQFFEIVSTGDSSFKLLYFDDETITMRDQRKLVVLSSLLVPFMLIDDPNNAYGEAPKILLTTANGSTFVEVAIDKGIVGDNTFTIDSPQEVKFDITFLHPGAFDPITHVNYQFHIADESGNMLVHKTGLHLHDGMDTQSVAFSTMDSFTLTIDVIGTGLSEPYDTTNSGTVSTTIAVTPEFPLGVMAMMAVLAGIGVLVTRLKNPLKL